MLPCPTVNCLSLAARGFPAWKSVTNITGIQEIIMKKSSKINNINNLTISLLNPRRIIKLSYGEIDNAKTINIITKRPEIGGLFCERIFGPVAAGRCHCGKYQKAYHKKGTICEKCGVEINNPVVRKKRFGHISLVTPVVHIWFRSIIAKLLDIPPKALDRIISYQSYIIVAPGESQYQKHEVISANDYFAIKSSKSAASARFKAATGAGIIKYLLKSLKIDSLVEHLKKREASRRVTRRLHIARDFQKSGNKPEWMVLDVLPVLPADLRPILFLEDGTVASSDLNDLYIRIMNRNQRLKRLLRLGAPELIINTEKRSLQASVDALFDNGRKYTAKDRSNKRVLKSLSEMLRSKKGRLRRNLLGKRVDYSGRSVIVVGPELKLHQCGIPKDLAMDIFRPFVYGQLMRLGYASSLKHAKLLVEKKQPEAMEALEHEIREKTILLNRAPSLHRMSIQAFDPVLVEGKAIQLHPLVCSAFNADFDGDQMGVHLPVSIEAQIESRVLMLSVYNILSPASGKLIMSPSQDMVLGIYYLTKKRRGCKGEGKLFADPEDAVIAYDGGVVDLQAKIKVRINDKLIDTTPGRVIFSEIFPPQIPFEALNKNIRKKDLNKLIELCYDKAGHKETVVLLDKIKDTGFKFATLSGISLCIDDLSVPREKESIIKETGGQVKDIQEQYSSGTITDKEKHNKIIDLWLKASDRIATAMMENYGIPDDDTLTPEEKQEKKAFNSVFMMADSGARGSVQQIKQVAGMRGLMAKPTGEIVEVPIKSNFKEGLSYHEFLLSSHGARKGRADGALKTANAGYFTRKLVDAAHDVVINEYDCGTTKGITTSALTDNDTVIVPIEERIYGKIAAESIVDPVSGSIIVQKNNEISKTAVTEIKAVGITSVRVRSPITCDSRKGICAMCYGYDLSSRRIIDIGSAVGIIAAQSIGEPGTQLTLRTFHSGGSASGATARSLIEAKESGIVKFSDIKCADNKNGRSVVVNRNGRLLIKNNAGVEKDMGTIPYGAVLYLNEGMSVESGQIIAEWDPFNMPVIALNNGTVIYEDIIKGLTMKKEIDDATGISRMAITSITENLIPRIIIENREYFLPIGAILTVNEGDSIKAGDVIARIPKQVIKNVDITGGLNRVLQVLDARKLDRAAILADINGTVKIHPPKGRYMTVEILGEHGDSKKHPVSIDRQLNVYNGDCVKAGDILADGVVDARDILRVLGPEKAAIHIINEIQLVYKSQGVTINDKHLEILVRKMLGMVQIVEPGDTSFISGEIVPKHRFIEANSTVEVGKAIAKPILLGITAVALLSESWLSAASFQRTTSVLAQSAIQGKTDYLKGSKENIIVGNIVPLGTAHPENIRGHK